MDRIVEESNMTIQASIIFTQICQGIILAVMLGIAILFWAWVLGQVLTPKMVSFTKPIPAKDLFGQRIYIQYPIYRRIP